MPQYPSEELRASDPLGYLEAEAEYRRAVDKRNDFDRKAQYVAQQQRAQEEQQHNQFLEQQAMPFWIYFCPEYPRLSSSRLTSFSSPSTLTR